MNHARRAALIARMKMVGVSDRLMKALALNMDDIVRSLARLQGDTKNRHYVLLIFTEEGSDDTRPGTMMSSDMVSSMEKQVAVELTSDWLQGTRKQRQ